jgi:hypothetical protein
MVQSTVEAALRSITNYTTDALAPTLAAFYGQDASRSPNILETYGHETKPRLSRILIAIGLMTQFSYSQKLALLLSARARALQLYRGVVGLIICLLLVVVSYWLGSRVSLPVDIGPFLKSGKFWSIAQGVGLLLANLVFWSVVLLPLSFAYHLFFGLMIRGQFQDEAETIVHAWTSFKEHYRELILLPVVVTILVAIFHPSRGAPKGRPATSTSSSLLPRSS